MSRSNWRVVFAVVVGLAFIAAFIGYGLFEQSRYDYEAANQRADYAKYAADEIQQTCFGEIGVEKAKCLHKAVAEYRLKTRDNQREQADLVAQRKSAVWTALMGIAALIGMALSVVGVFLVWTTFRETKAANRIAAASGRPWLNIVAELTPDQPVNWVTHGDQETCVISISFSVEHFGNAPAVNVETIGQIVDGMGDVEEAIERQKRRANSSGGKFLPITVFPGEKPEPLAVGINFQPHSDGTGRFVILPYLVTCASYTNPATGERHMSIRVYRITQNRRLLTKANCPFPSSRLAMHVSRNHPPFYT